MVEGIAENVTVARRVKSLTCGEASPTQLARNTVSFVCVAVGRDLMRRGLSRRSRRERASSLVPGAPAVRFPAKGSRAVPSNGAAGARVIGCSVDREIGGVEEKF